jgi:glycosyltransferase involved in cell wall biosynthesis
MPKFSIVTPTIMRITADRTMASVDAQTSSDYEHIVVIDGAEPAELSAHAAERWASPRRKFIRCGARHNDCGATCRNIAAHQATGDYILYLDDDDYYVPDAIETLVRLVGDRGPEAMGVFPITMGGVRWLVLPPGECRTATCQIYHRRLINGEVVAMPVNQRRYSEDSAWAGYLAKKHGYRVLDCHELAVVEYGRNSSNLPGGPQMVELPQVRMVR